MTTQALTGEDAARLQQKWLQNVEELVRDVEEWAQAKGWTTSVSQADINEGLIGSYAAPICTINTNIGQLILEPVAYDVAGARGRVDLYAYPTLLRVMLLHGTRENESGWVVRTESGIDWPQPWNRDTFYNLAKGLLRAV